MVAGVDKTTYAIAVALAALAGYVDAMGFVTVGGFFVSFMSGNTTRMGVAAVEGRLHPTLVGAAILALFVLGVVLGSLLGGRAGAWRRAAVMVFVAALLVVALVGSSFGIVQIVVAALALAMGAENTVFEGSSGSSISLTYMTGALVRLGRGIAEALTGGSRRLWMRDAGMWLGLLAGVVAGTAVHRGIGLAGLWPAVVVAVVLAIGFARRPDLWVRAGA